ncbi:Zinc metallopeptidase protein [Ketogulonicigenium robustum]|uniref:Zinc metallopeptidase protein n=1 Tax=Ketogulonicigenium robustum TaxID=92947 RepID=A0A1W6P1E7_9RHOB|nr:SprT family zinc-dependent metalloprotease [Ketogulonicigenium robustum]ARO15332.1 Zinc metallopeptidase protein [Ketogulonicigenium robustum]
MAGRPQPDSFVLQRHTSTDAQPILVKLRRNARATRLTLRIAQRDGAVTLTLPPRTPVAEAQRFAESRRDWIIRHLPAQGLHALRLGDQIPLRGTLLTLATGAQRGVQATPTQLCVPGGVALGPRVAAFLKAQARDDISHAADIYAAKTGRAFTRLTLRDTRSRWGSCTSDGALMFNWRLVMAPPAILHYVAAHEVAHLTHMDHSDRFWSLVAQIFPDHAAARQWLRTHGVALQRLDFSS